MRFLIPIILLSSLALAQDSAAPAARIIRIEMNDGTTSGNIRFGPITYEHPDPEGITATVSNLTILASQAVLSVPAEQQDELLLSEAEGSREASFENGVLVTRGRLEARGPSLVYSEATGLGVLAGPADIFITAATADGEDVSISAQTVEFDVDTDISTSSGEVVLESGNQVATAAQLVYAEERSLGVLQAEAEQVRIVRLADDGRELVITADEVRVLTEEERLYAAGNVTVIDGDITSTGSEVFFDDAASRAEVLGSPAHSVDTAAGVELTGDRLEHRTDLGVVSIIDASLPSEFDLAAFALTEGELD